MTMKWLVFLTTTNDGHFWWDFWAFGACLYSFIQYIHLVISIDIVYLFIKYSSVLMMVTTIDESNNL